MLGVMASIALARLGSRAGEEANTGNNAPKQAELLAPTPLAPPASQQGRM